MKSKNVT